LTGRPLAPLLRTRKLCRWCVGRLIEDDPQLVEKTGIELAQKQGIELHDEDCELCHGFFHNVSVYVNEALEKLKREGIEFERFYVSLHVPREILDKEDELRSSLKSTKGMSIKRYANFVLARIISEKTGKKPDYLHPDIIISFGLKGYVEVKIMPLYIAGRYVKHNPNIDHSPTPRQRRTKTTLEDEVKKKLLSIFHAVNAKFSWTGTDGYGVTVRGNGRPFFAKIINPRTRFSWVKHAVLSQANSGITLVHVRVSKREELLEGIKKEYFDVIKAKILLSNEPPIEPTRVTEILENTFSGRTIVLRKPGKERRKTVRFIRVEQINDKNLEVKMCVQHGFDIRKLFSCKSIQNVSSEKATPSLEEVLGVACLGIDYEVLTVTESCEHGFI
jgi:tRNA pseudouridine synthase 10